MRCAMAAGAGLLALAQTGFGEIDVALNPAKDVVVDDLLITKLENGFALDLEQLIRQLLVFR